MPVICPTVTANDLHEYRDQMESIARFAWRVHIDFMDGDFAPSKSPSVPEAWWPEGVKADLHLMYKKPLELIDAIAKLKPDLVIMHAEAEGDFVEFAGELKIFGIRSGLALLPETPVSKIAPLLNYADHVLIFAGKLGFQGGEANMDMLDKVRELRALKPSIEIAWDGGVDDKNARVLAIGGVDVLNVGGYIKNAPDPVHAYATLKALLEQLDEKVNPTSA